MPGAQRGPVHQHIRFNLDEAGRRVSGRICSGLRIQFQIRHYRHSHADRSRDSQSKLICERLDVLWSVYIRAVLLHGDSYQSSKVVIFLLASRHWHGGV